MKCKALIISIKGTKLSKKKITFIKRKAVGYYSFKRNLKSFKQIKKLTSEIKKFTKNKNFNSD